MSLLMLPKIFRPKCRNYILHMDYILHNQITYGILLCCPCKMQILPKNYLLQFFFNRCQHHYKSKITEDFKYIFQVICYKILSHLTFSNTSGKLLHVSVKYLKAIHSQCCFHKQQQQLLACYNF